MKNPKPLIAITLIAATAAASFLLPKAKYTSPDVLSKLSIPEKFYYWSSRDTSADFNPNDLRYNFISRVFAREYRNKYGQRLMFLVLDAGNFHNPKVCYRASGYTATDLPDPVYKLKDRTFKANAVFFDKPGESCVIVYWITINKKRVDWTGQKILQLWYSLFNREKVGLMVRMDIPATRATIDSALKLSREFIQHLAPELPAEQQDYLFGK
ncbi:MAG: EpsI family protein [Candidatus Omnitrophica bacterium]|nr:EpsI family protein [Candidatus Omnitrophota bacterium]